MPRDTKRSGCNSGNSTTSRSFSNDSSAPPTSSYVTSGFSSTVIMVTCVVGSGAANSEGPSTGTAGHKLRTEGSILGGSGTLILNLERSTPTRMPSSMSVGATLSSKATTNLAIWRRVQSAPWSPRAQCVTTYLLDVDEVLGFRCSGVHDLGDLRNLKWLLLLAHVLVRHQVPHGRWGQPGITLLDAWSHTSRMTHRSGDWHGHHGHSSWGTTTSTRGPTDELLHGLQFLHNVLLKLADRHSVRAQTLMTCDTTWQSA